MNIMNIRVMGLCVKFLQTSRDILFMIHDLKDWLGIHLANMPCAMPVGTCQFFNENKRLIFCGFSDIIP